MAHRNLTSTFLHLRHSKLKKQHKFRQNIKNNSNEPTPTWIYHVEQVNSKMKQLQLKIEFLKKVHTRRLMIRFDNTEENDEQEINSLTQDITVLFQQTEKIVEQITTTCYSKSNAHRNICTNIQHSYASKLQQLSQKFRKGQKEYLSKLKAQKNVASPHELFDFLTGDTPTKSETSFAQEMIVDAADIISKERDTEVQRISKSIADLSSVFKDVAALIIDQGSIVDRIDYNMEQVVCRMESGLKELHRAERYQKNNRANRCIGVLVFLISCCFMVLLNKHY